MTIVVDSSMFEDAESLIMADDGKGESVNIPTFMVSLYDGMKLKEAIHHKPPANEDGGHAQKRNKVIIQADIDLITKTDDQIEVDLWYTGAYELKQANIDLAKYSQMQEIFGEKVRFQPRILTTKCNIFCSLTETQQCIQDGKYCPMIPIQMRTQDQSGILPRNLLMQSVREQCVFDNLNDGFKSHWFRYMDVLTDECTNFGSSGIEPIMEECNTQVIDTMAEEGSISIDIAGYNSCVLNQESILFNEDGATNDTSYLERDRAAEQAVGNMFHPSVAINNHTFRGEYEDPNDLFKTICSVIKTKPDICQSVNINIHHMQDEYGINLTRDQKGQSMQQAIQNYKDESKNLVGMERRAEAAEIILGLIIVLILNCACIAYCKMFNKDKTEK